jgi:NitT/TauT family transport system ATP-binding protein
LQPLPSALFCRDLTVRFGDGADVLGGVSCDFLAGEISSLVGPSGCGKTTLLRVLAGLQTPTSGTVSIEPPARANRGEMAFVFQQPTLLPWRTAVENVKLAIRLSEDGVSAAEAKSRAERELALMELPCDAFGRFPRELSGGMKMRVSLARAMVTRPTVLLLDEPFAALDDMSRSALGDLLLRRWDERPFTAVMVTHNIAEAALLSHRVMVLDRGRIGATIPDDLPRPRDETVRTSAEFGKLYATISAALRNSSGAAPATEISATEISATEISARD